MLQRIKSPYSYLTQFNKEVERQNVSKGYDNEDQFPQRLPQQKLSKIQIPKPFIERHNEKLKKTQKQLKNDSKEKEDLEYEQSDTEDDTHVIRRKQQKRHQEEQLAKQSQKNMQLIVKRMKESDIDFINTTQRKKFSISKYQTFAVTQRKQNTEPSTSTQRQNYSLTKVLSSMPLTKLQQIQQDRHQNWQKDNFELIQQKSSLNVMKQNDCANQKLIPKVINKSICKPINNFLTLAEGTLRNFKKHQKIRNKNESIEENLITVNDIFNMDTDIFRNKQDTFIVNSKTPPLMAIDHQYKIESIENKGEDKSKFRMKTETEINNLFDRVLNQKQQSVQHAKSVCFNKESINNNQYNLPQKIIENIQKNITKLPLNENEEKKQIYNYQRYFYLNYMKSYQGIVPKLSKKSEQNLNQFHTEIQSLISKTHGKQKEREKNMYNKEDQN